MRRPRVVSIIGIILAAVPFAAPSLCPHCPPGPWTVGQTVQTTSGPVVGHGASVASHVSEYLGIPYAQPPVGALRFRGPVRYKGTTKIDGKSFGPACMSSNISAFDADFPQELIEEYGITDVGRSFLKYITNTGIPVSEDCLTLNIWTKPQTGEKRKAVMIFAHGGSFVTGSSAVAAYNGQFFADEEDVVLVTINYRLTIFGFPGNPLGAQNLGLLDQRLAVEWVRDNIASFGGDPSRITFFGESAGGASVDDYSHAWPHDPIVAGLISMSGTTRGIGVRTPELAAALWYNTTSALGCGNAATPPGPLLACMRRAPAAAIIATLINIMASPISVPPYSPTIDNVLVFPPDSANTTTNAARVPLLIGTTDNESGLFKLFTPKASLPPGIDPAAFWHALNQKTFVCPAAARAAASARAGNPTWRYRWHGAFPNTAIAADPPSGAYHGSELAVLFGTTTTGGNGNNTINDTREEGEIGRYMRGAWAAFARDPRDGLQRYRDGWPRYRAEERTLARIGWENRTGPNLVRGDYYDDGC